MKTNMFFFTIMLFSLNLFSQSDNCTFLLKGKIIDRYKVNIPFQDITVNYKILQNSESVSKVIQTDIHGDFTFCLPVNRNPSLVSIEIKRNGFYTFLKKMDIPNPKELDLKVIKIYEKEQIETPAPTEYFESSKLYSVGRSTIGKSLHLISPGFNSTSQPISDGSAHFDPTDFRNLGSSRTLFLINGVRKNTSANIQVNDVPNKGEVGIDIQSIPMAAIERVVIEKQEKTTLLGSDAIAGTIDFKLKENTNEFFFSPIFGLNKDNWDGKNYGFDFNKGFQLGNQGFVNFTFSQLTQKESNRPNINENTYDSLYIESRNNIWESWLAKHPNLGMKIGSPNMTTNTIFYNTALKFSKDSDDKFYSFGGITYRNTQSYAIYRTPYWIKDSYNIFSKSQNQYDGFQPTFESDVTDNFFVMGINGRISGSKDTQLEYDLSQTVSNNDIDYTVNNSFNPSLGVNSPTSFKVGGYKLNMNNTKLSLSWTKNNFDVNFGAEFRNEKYIIKTGEEKSYIGEGTISYSGTQPLNSLVSNRNNFGSFIQMKLNNSNLNIDGSIRYEKYTNFPENIAFQISSLYKLVDVNNIKALIRGSYSTGFRAPSLQQLYYNRVQTLVSGSNVSNRGTFNSFSPVIRQLGIPTLKNENSENISLGTSFNFLLNDESGIKFSIDYYRIAISNRLVLSGNIDTVLNNSNKVINQILKQNNISSLNFFLNAINTQTSGIDLSLRYYTSIAKINFEFSSSANITYKNTLSLNTDDIPNSLSTIDIFDRKEQSRLLYSRPSSKIFTNLKLEKIGTWEISLNYSFFGKVKWFHPTDSNKDQIFNGKGLVNLFFEHSIGTNLSSSISINNLFNVYPDKLEAKGDPRTNVGGRFKYYREVNQFDYNGTSILLRFIFRI